MNPRNLLLISYHFPPVGGSGVQRAVKLARYLPESGWRPHVLTAGHTHFPLLDQSLADEIPIETTVHRIRGFEAGGIAAALCGHMRRGEDAPHWLAGLEDRLYWRLERMLSRYTLPDDALPWVWHAVREARRLIRRHRIETVVTTSPPVAAHLVGLALKRRLGIPWIADMRDPIVENFAHDRRSRMHTWYVQRVERAVLRMADHCVVTCPELRERLIERYPAVPAERISTIPNGFDPADEATAQNSWPRKRFLLAYVGAFYREQSIGPVLEAIRRLRAKREDIRERLTFRLIGSVAASQKRLIHPEDSSFFEFFGYRTHREAVAQMAAADLLLLMTPANAGGRLCIPAKAFEYLGFGRHLLALVHPDTMLADLLSQSGNTTVLTHPVPAGAFAEGIERCFDGWADDTLDTPRTREVVDRFRRDRIAGRFAQILEHCMDGTPRLRLAPDESASEEAA